MKIYLFGANGMLGSYVSRVMNTENISRNDIDISECDTNKLEDLFFNTIPGSVVINCAGLIKQKMTEADAVKAIKINSVFPHILSDVCNFFGLPLIHISTDCCFSGHRGGYSELDTPDAEDIYGQSKAAGEPCNAVTIRTSIVGESEYKGSLLEWVRSQTEVNGFMNHLWNGVTCLQLAKAIKKLIETKDFDPGVFHYFGETVTKAELIRMIDKTYGLNLKINYIEAPTKVDRTLKTIYNKFPEPPRLIEQLKEQHDF